MFELATSKEDYARTYDLFFVLAAVAWSMYSACRVETLLSSDTKRQAAVTREKPPSACPIVGVDARGGPAVKPSYWPYGR